MKINLLHRYSGVLTNERKLQAGIHDLDETLAKYLVDNGHAEYVDLPQAVASEPVSTIIESRHMVNEEHPANQPNKKRR